MMQIVIEIPEEEYIRICNEPCTELGLAVRNGISLPKGHGRLIDVSDLIPDSDYEDGIFYAVSIGAINGAPTIIEADKGEKVGEQSE